MNKELLDKYSKISVIIIAIILIVSFIWVVCSKIWIPYYEKFKQGRIDQEYSEVVKKHNEIVELHNKCYVKIDTNSKQRLFDNCTHRISSGYKFDERFCVVDKNIVLDLDNYIKNKVSNSILSQNLCSEYFQCDSDFLKTNSEIKQLEQKSCDEKYSY